MQDAPGDESTPEDRAPQGGDSSQGSDSSQGEAAEESSAAETPDDAPASDDIAESSADADSDADADAASSGITMPTVVTHGFASQGFILTTGNEYLAHSKHGSFELTEVGINFTSELSDRLRVGFQLFARDLGPTGNYAARFDWFYFDYRVADWLGIRAGRTKLPYGLYNDTSDIDAANVPVLLPQSVYPVTNRDFLLAQTGVELYGRFDLGSAGALEYRMYGGTIFVSVTSSPLAPFEVNELRVPYLVGGRLMWETPVEGLRVGASVQALRLETDLVPAMTRMVAHYDIFAALWLASIEFNRGPLLLAVEYGRWHVDTSTDTASLPTTDSESERGYAMLAYRFAPWLQLGAYYSLLFPDVQHRSGRQNRQHDVALTARFDVTSHLLVKLEGHLMNGTAGASSSLNGGVPLSRLDETWFVFLAKATAYF